MEGRGRPLGQAGPGSGWSLDQFFTHTHVPRLDRPDPTAQICARDLCP